MTLTGLLIAAVALVAPSDTKVLKLDQLGMTIRHPAAWTVAKSKVQTTVEIPCEGKRTAKVQLLSSLYRDTAEAWQSLQLRASESMRRKVDEQWQEELLSVPLLMTRTKYQLKGQELVSLVGLLYAATDHKLQFIMTAPADVAPDAEAAWRSALLTLRTKEGDLPEKEYSNRPPDAEKPKPVKPKNKLVLKAETAAPKKLERGPVSASVKVGDTAYTVYLPKGWTASLAGQGVRLSQQGLQGVVTLGVESGGREQADKRLDELAAMGLERFTVVSLRMETEPRFSRAGCLVRQVRREGKFGKDPLALLCAVGSRGDLFWTLTYEASDAGALKRDKGRVEALVDWLSVESGS